MMMCVHCEMTTGGLHQPSCPLFLGTQITGTGNIVFGPEKFGTLASSDNLEDIMKRFSKPSPTAQVLNDVGEERKRQDAKWGEQNHNIFTWLAILGEEVGETNQAALKAHFGGKPWSNYREELIQVAAVAVAMVECLDRHNGVSE